MLFRDRREAGQRLAERLHEYANRPDVVVLALPRGGVPVGYEVAKALRTPLDVFLVRKLGVPWQEELAMGAIASGGVRVVNEEVVLALDIPDRVIDSIAALEQEELDRREKEYRADRPPPDVQGKTVILVDDGLATGSTMRAAIAALDQLKPAHIIVAVPTASPEACRDLEREADRVVCAITPEPFYGVGRWYENFTQVTDQQVRDLLEKAEKERAGHSDPSSPQAPI